MSFDKTKVEAFLLKNCRIDYIDAIDSTNTELVRRVKEGSAHCGDVIAAGTQTAGRGRRGNSFYSPEGGIYFSFAAKNSEGAMPTVICGAAVAETLEGLGYDPEIKWVNDVLLGGKKVCGILAEAVTDTGLCVIGVGINLKSSSIPEELSETAAALDGFGPKPPSREELVGMIVSKYFASENEEAKTLTDRYRRYLKFLGKEIMIKHTGEISTALGVTDKGELEVMRLDGTAVLLNSGEISILLD